MFVVFRKEINIFFSSLIGYITVGVFLLVLSLFIWVVSDTNVVDYGYAGLDQLFSIAPNLFLFLIPAVTMRSFAEETQNGTIELLVTRPLTEMAIILGKYFAATALVAIAILPTIIYYITIYKLGDPVGNIDTGACIGSYLGLLLLGSTFAAIGIFASSLTNNQIVSFILATFLCFFCFLGFEFMSGLPIFMGKSDVFVQSLGMSYHYDALGRGLINLKDVVYFISVIGLFLAATRLQLERRNW
jgi:ABC-2 type transport system permease protein